MNIYVDPLYPTPRTKRWNQPEAAHLFCLPGDVEILRQFGNLMGLPEERWVPNGVVAHWEITREEWEIAVEAGAKRVSREGMQHALKLWRAERAKFDPDRRRRRGPKK